MLKKIDVAQLAIGMHLHELCGSWMSHPFLRSKFTITDPNDIRLIVDSGIREAWIDIGKGIDVAAPQPVAPAPQAAAPVQPPRQRVAMAEEMRRAAQICDSAKGAVKSMFQEVRMGRAIAVEEAGELVEEISSSLHRNSAALISLARLKRADDYTYLHSVAVCALMLRLARQLGLDQAGQRAAGMAGLLHDIGKALIPLDILNKPGKLAAHEFAVIMTHPEQGLRLLRDAGTAGEVTLDVCQHHHEKIDGTGYPQRLTGEQISDYAKMGAVCDVYDAITSNRPYKAGWDPAVSVRKMSEWSGTHFDPRTFESFVRCIGIYPVGSLVRLASGRLGVVVEPSDHSLLAPKVRVFFSTKSQVYLKPELVDLSLPGCSERIVDREDGAKWGITNYDRFWADAG